MLQDENQRRKNNNHKKQTSHQNTNLSILQLRNSRQPTDGKTRTKQTQTTNRHTKTKNPQKIKNLKKINIP